MSVDGWVGGKGRVYEPLEILGKILCVRVFSSCRKRWQVFQNLTVIPELESQAPVCFSGFISWQPHFEPQAPHLLNLRSRAVTDSWSSWKMPSV